MPYIDACMWDLEKNVQMDLFENRNRDTDIENKCPDTKGRKAELR